MRCCYGTRRCDCYGCDAGRHCDPRSRAWWRVVANLLFGL